MFILMFIFAYSWTLLKANMHTGGPKYSFGEDLRTHETI